jgi:hypothetical protein
MKLAAFRHFLLRKRAVRGKGDASKWIRLAARVGVELRRHRLNLPVLGLNRRC